MRIIAKGTLRDFWRKHRKAEGPLRAWYQEAKNASWRNPTQIKARFRMADHVGGNRIVFNIGGNNYRLVVQFRFDLQIGFIRFVGTHAQYDKIDVKTI